jgi:hypothetical protein
MREAVRERLNRLRPTDEDPGMALTVACAERLGIMVAPGPVEVVERARRDDPGAPVLFEPRASTRPWFLERCHTAPPSS